jgi:hypothetical protein
MPRIELIPEVLYTANDPIHWEFDNLPLRAILDRQGLINNALDNVLEELRDAIGSQGSVANRLNQSINGDGTLKKSAVDATMHTMDDHTDTDDYVRMTKAQSDKLDEIADDATDVTVTVYTESGAVEFTTGNIEIHASDTVEPTVDSPNIVKFNMVFPAEAAHQHYYGLVPVHDNIVTPDYINYKVTSGATPFVEGSLRIYINGVRIFSDAEVYAPGVSVNDPWTLLSFTEDPDNGLFELSSAITEDDVIRIDFDIALV